MSTNNVAHPTEVLRIAFGNVEACMQQRVSTACLQFCTHKEPQLLEPTDLITSQRPTRTALYLSKKILFNAHLQ